MILTNFWVRSKNFGFLRHSSNDFVKRDSQKVKFFKNLQFYKILNRLKNFFGILVISRTIPYVFAYFFFIY